MWSNVGIMQARKKQSAGRNACLFDASSTTKFHVDRPRIEPATPRCEAGD